MLALFPLLPETRPGTCASYEHIGQHGSADYAHCIGATRPADLEAPNVASLKRELEAIGYRLRVAKRAPGWRAVATARKAGL